MMRWLNLMGLMLLIHLILKQKNWSDGDNGTKELEKMVPLNYL